MESYQATIPSSDPTQVSHDRYEKIKAGLKVRPRLLKKPDTNTAGLGEERMPSTSRFARRLDCGFGFPRSHDLFPLLRAACIWLPGCH